MLNLAAEAGARARPLEHRPGGRRRRLRLALAATTSSTAPIAGTTSSSPRPSATSCAADGVACRELHRRRARRAAAHAGRDLRPGRGLLPGPRRLDAPAVARGRRDGHQRHRRRRGAAGAGLRVQPAARPAPTPSPSPTSATARSTSARCSSRSTSPPPGSCRSASSSRTTCTPSRRPSQQATGEPRLSARGLGLQHPELAGRRHGPARGAPGDGSRPASTCAPAAARRSSRPRSTATSTRTAPTPAAPSATAPRRRRRAGATATRSAARATTLLRRGLVTDERARPSTRSRPSAMTAIGDELRRAGTRRQAGPAPHPGRPVAGPGLRRRGHPR